MQKMMHSNSHHHSGAYQPPDFQHPQVQHAEPPKTHPQQYLQSQHSMHGTELIGRPIHFMSGQFAGQTIRAELYEVQKADLGRKCVSRNLFASSSFYLLKFPTLLHLRQVRPSRSPTTRSTACSVTSPLSSVQCWNRAADGKRITKL
jgi:hypothetical protein